MVKMQLRTLTRSIAWLQQALKQLINGLLGRDRRDKQRLMRHLNALQAEHNLMQRNWSDEQHLAELEIEALTCQMQADETARDDLQLRIWELEQQVQELLSYIASAPQAETSDSQRTDTAATAIAPTTIAATAAHPETHSEAHSEVHLGVDLSDTKLGLVGGHPATRRGVIKTLTAQYHLRCWVVIPPLKEAKIRKNKLKHKLRQCTLIVIIADYMSHPLTHAVFGLRASGALIGEVALINCHGKTGVVREIVNLVKQQNIEN
ncbi:MAG: hypothetical protein AAGG53_16000 [Cyanobacteria bacterium P01_H01_bin.152]